MKTVSTLLLICLSIYLYAQDEPFRLQGKIINKQGNPVSDVYILNPNSMEKDISLSNGVFTVSVHPGDSLVLSHISYLRKIVTVQTLLQNPIITIESESVDIPEVTVTPDKTNDSDRAKQNLSFLKEYKPLSYTKIKTETNPVNTIMTEHNRIMRTEAGSINLLQFPLQLIGKKLKRSRLKNPSNDYYSTRKQKQAEDDQ